MTLTADLTGKTALVTGASSGFGAHFARVLAAAGARVVVAARRVAALDALVAGLGEGARAIALDIRDEASIAAAAEAGDVDILVNNAGIGVDKPVLDQDRADWEDVVGTNLRGAFLLSNAIARTMRDRGAGGSIINIASVLGLRQGGHVAIYAISKAGVIQMTKQHALELARYGIRANAIAPGYFNTAINDDLFATPAGERLIKRVPMRRLGELADLDGALLLLASDASRFMTGSVIAVDGGHLVSAL